MALRSLFKKELTGQLQGAQAADSPHCKQFMAATELRSSSAGRASQSLSTGQQQDSSISAQHGTALGTLLLVELPVRVVLGFSEPQ